MESGAQALHAEVPIVEPGRGHGGVETLAIDGSFSAIELIEEYGLLALVLGAVLVVLFRRTKTAVESAAFEASVRRREDSMRKVREMQQARYEMDSAEQRAKLAEVAERQRKEKLEEMEAMAEGYAHERACARGRAVTRTRVRAHTHAHTTCWSTHADDSTLPHARGTQYHRSCSAAPYTVRPRRRTAKHKKDQKKGRTDTRDFWDNAEGFSSLNGGGGGGSTFRPTCRRRGG